ncbi:putative Flavin-containing monooxygenase FMO GS-OX-like 9 [Hypsibius exemplaris]|uniref:Flavin-containing monooxygenase n=1 Tax=Hypsibius exemplaris TaxID=2072580 RepID=A0A9X6NBX2_HYPEX|nr:putative Flavin-containing monooxygenase FMO GS-OX-like 9 [Hypsibius exemplaris]
MSITKAVAFEQANRIGGVLELPQGCEERLDMDQASPVFLSHVQKHEQYLGSYAQHFGLSPFIKTGRRVSSITPILIDGEEPSVGIGPRWTVESVDLQTKSKTEEIFDAVLVCTGKYHHPYIPEISGLPEYKGTVLHSSVYRDPERYRNKVVLIIGGGPSAVDIATDLTRAAKNIILAKKQPGLFFRNANPKVLETAMPKNFTASEVILHDGSSRHIDVVILCTGYSFDFPFLSKECRVQTSRGRVSPLYRHLIHCEYPSMAFPFLVTLVTITPILDCQIKFFKAVLDGKALLPTAAEMLYCTKNDYHQRLASIDSSPRHVAHGLPGEEGWNYMTELGTEGEFPPYEPVIRQMAQVAFAAIQSGDPDYKKAYFQRTGQDTFVYVANSDKLNRKQFEMQLLIASQEDDALENKLFGSLHL